MNGWRIEWIVQLDNKFFGSIEGSSYWCIDQANECISYWCIEWIVGRINKSFTEKSEHALALDQLTTDSHFCAHQVSQMKSSDQLDSSGRSKRLCSIGCWSLVFFLFFSFVDVSSKIIVVTKWKIVLILFSF